MKLLLISIAITLNSFLVIAQPHHTPLIFKVYYYDDSYTVHKVAYNKSTIDRFYKRQLKVKINKGIITYIDIYKGLNKLAVMYPNKTNTLIEADNYTREFVDVPQGIFDYYNHVYLYTR